MIAEIETVIIVHGDDTTITIKDNPDAPEYGTMIKFEETQGGLKAEWHLSKEDLPFISKAIMMHFEASQKKENNNV